MGSGNDWSWDKAETVIGAVLKVANERSERKNSLVFSSRAIKKRIDANLSPYVVPVLRTLVALKFLTLDMVKEYPTDETLTWSGHYMITPKQISGIRRRLKL